MEENKTMDPRLAETVKGIWNSLTDEQRDKVCACKTSEELLSLAAKEGVELPDEVMEAVAGGYIFGDTHSKNPFETWEAIRDSDGTVIGKFETAAQAADCAYVNGQSTDVIDQDRLLELRGEKKKGC